jgi:cullin 1
LSSIGKDVDETAAKVFEESFQKPFIEQTETYYTNESSVFLSNPDHSFTDYMDKCTARLEQENERINHYLNESLLEPLIKTVENALIVKKIDRFIEEFRQLLNGNNVDQLSTLYKLVIRVPSAISQLCRYFQSHIRKEGLEAIESCVDKAIEDPQTFVLTIWRVYEKHRNLLDKALASDPAFYKALDSVSTQKMTFDLIFQCIYFFISHIRLPWIL